VSGFRRRASGVTTTFGAEEAAQLQVLFQGLLRLLQDEQVTPSPAPGPGDPLERLVAASDRPVPTPEHPVLARLFPDAYADPELSAEYRRLTQGDLRAGKVSAVQSVIGSLDRLPTSGRLRLDGAGAEEWLTALNDLRLTLGVLLDVTEDTYEEIPRLALDDPRRASLELFAWLGWLQETLVEALADM
jgi:hypothetical protein